MKLIAQALTGLLVLSLPSFGQGTIQHIVVIIQENHTFDQFEGVMSRVNGFANPSNPTAPNNLNGTVSLIHIADPTLDSACTDNSHQGSVSAIDGGKMDGFMYRQCSNDTRQVCNSNADCGTGQTCLAATYQGCSNNFATQCSQNSDCGGNNTCEASTCYSYYTGTELPWFYQMASTYGTNDNFFSGMSGPSMPNHLIAIAATTNDIVDNPMNVGNIPPGANNLWTCQVTDANGVIPISAPAGYTTENGHIAMNDISATGAANRYHQGICGGKCTAGPKWGQYCSADADCGSGYTCSYLPQASNTRCQCPAETYPGTAAACVDSACAPAPPAGVNSCQITRTYSGSTAQPGNLCPSVTTLFDRLLGNHSHRWYGPSINEAGYDWVAAAYTPSVFNTTDNHIFPYQQFLTDVAHNALPAVSFISPPNSVSEHSGEGTVAAGQAYLQSTVRAITGNPTLYATTAVFIYYDDFGGFYDHVQPPTMGISQYDNMGVGMRVPNLCIGPYCRNTVIHTLMTPDSISKCIEDFAFGTQSGMGYAGGSYLTERDSSANSACAADGSGFIDLTQTPISAPSLTPASTETFSSVHLLAPRGNGEPDLTELVQRTWHRIFPKKEAEANDREADYRPQLLNQRPCAPEYVPEMALYHEKPTSVCVWHGLRNGNILRPGEQEGDPNEGDAPPRPATR